MGQVFIVDDSDGALCRKLNKIGIVPSDYSSLIDLRWFEELKFCGCGNPDGAREYIAKILRAIKDRSDSDWATDSVAAAIKGDAESAMWLILYVFDAMGLLEHGGNVSGSWLTDKGKQLLAELDKEQPK